MYESLLFIHSWTRWVVLASAFALLILGVRGMMQTREWTPHDAHFAWAFEQVFFFQSLFGLTLWFAASPITHAAFLNPRAILETPLYQFWTLRHPLTMLAALGVFQVGKAHFQKQASPFRALTVTMTTVLALIVSAVPWPFLSYGRALFRTDF